jgi:hypothetical protein
MTLKYVLLSHKNVVNLQKKVTVFVYVVQHFDFAHLFSFPSCVSTFFILKKGKTTLLKIYANNTKQFSINIQNDLLCY